MHNASMSLSIPIFPLTVFYIIRRHRGMNEVIPASIAALFLFVADIVPLSDVYQIFGRVSGASLTILSATVMSIVLESIGFFHWAANYLIAKANGSGIRLFWFDYLKPWRQQQIPFRISGALVATGASAPIGVCKLCGFHSWLFRSHPWLPCFVCTGGQSGCSLERR